MSAQEHWLYRPLRDVHRCGLVLRPQAERAARSYADAAYPRESGGLLLGWWEHGVPVVVDVVKVPDSGAGRSHWTRSRQAAAEVFAQVRATYPATVGYVGDWHSHPHDVGPSGTDLRVIRRVSKQYDDAIALAVVRRGGVVDTRLALRGRLTTTDRIAQHINQREES